MTIAIAHLALLVGLSATRAVSQDSNVAAVGKFPSDLLPPESLSPDVQDLFDVACRPPKSANPCSEPGGVDLDPNGCKNLTAADKIDLPRSYYFNPTLQRCVGYIFKGCLLGANHFASLAECRAACTDVCEQSAPVPSLRSGETCELNRLVWYYNAGEGRCVQTLWDGCHVTNNVFESEGECTQTCLRLSVDADGTSLSSEIARSEEVSKFCNNVEPTMSPRPTTRPDHPLVQDSTTRLPELATVGTVENTARTMAPELVMNKAEGDDGNATADLKSFCEQLKCVRQSTSVNSRLPFVSVFARTDGIEVVVRLRCRKGITHRPSDTELDRLCELVRSGIEQYWTRPDGITVSCQNNRTVNVCVRVQLVSHWLGVNAKDVIVKVYDRDPLIGNKRSHNSDILPMTLKYDERRASSNRPRYDEQFKETSAHELGHSVLRAARGFRYSWTHKGTSTWYGKLLNSNPPPASGEIDLMKYFASPYPSDWLSRTIATEEDATSLLATAARSYCSKKACSSALQFPLGHPCFENKECQSNRCQYFRCVECTSHTHCKPGHFCAHRLMFWQPNSCQQAKRHGSLCLNDRECHSRRCHAGRCGDCKNDDQCPPGQVCSGRHLLIFEANRCKEPSTIGTLCTSDRNCRTGHCHAGRCGECSDDSHCPADKYCSGKLLGLLKANMCEDKKQDGAACTRDRECINDRCHGFRCGECETDNHCLPNEYCAGKAVGPFRANSCEQQKTNGAWCTRDRECASNHCHGLRCGQCKTDSHCHHSDYCSGNAVGPLQSNTCKRRKTSGAACSRNRQCVSGRCHFLSCVDCTEDSHCDLSRHCSKRPLGNGRCANRACTGFCLRDRQCVSNNCLWYRRCSEC